MRILLSCLILSACAVSSPAAVDFPEVEGWEPAGEVGTYGPENLWELIDGAAEQFLSYGFRELSYRDLTSEDLTVTVHIYDMGTPLNAFGIYTEQRPDSEKKRFDIGVEAALDPPYQGMLLKGPWFVKVEAYEGEIDVKKGKALLEAIARALPGDEAPPEELGLLPAAGRVDGSEGYARESFLGMADLKNCVYAVYRDRAGHENRLFLMLPAGGKTSEDIWTRLAGKWQTLRRDNRTYLYKSVPYKGIVGIARTGRGLLGVAGAKSELEMLKILGPYTQ